jgi:hypothetical protein
MSFDLPDIDIDVAHREHALSVLKGFTVASQVVKEQLIPHNTGIYLQRIPSDPLNHLAAFPYEAAEVFGYAKIDILPNNYYQGVEHEDHLKDLLDAPVDWDWFLDEEFIATLFHFGGTVDKDLSMAKLVTLYAPQSIPDIACLLAIKLPGKRYLIGEPWEKVRENIWKKETSGLPTFKKSHSYSYALVVIMDAQLKAPEHFGLV